MDCVDKELEVLIVTSKGYGKRTPAGDYRSQTRGGKGIKTINLTEKNGPVVGLKVVKKDEDLMIITTSGTLIRTSMDGISTMGRYAQGVKLINIREDDAVATLCRADKEEDELADDEEGLEGQTAVEESDDTDLPETDAEVESEDNNLE